MSEPLLPPTVPVVREQTGEIIIGQLPAAPAGSVSLPIPGGRLIVDPTAPEAAATGVLADEDLAHRIVDEVFGPAVANALGQATGNPILVPVISTEPGARLRQLAILRWLQTANPLPLDRGLLALETTVAELRCADLLDAEDQSGESATSAAEIVADLARVLRARRDPPRPSVLPGLVDDALDELMLVLPADAPVTEDLRHESDLRTAMETWGLSDLDWTRWEEMSDLFRPRAAVHAGSWPDEPASGEERTGQSSVDWLRVPPGLLDPGEATVAWTASSLGSGRARVEVDVASARTMPHHQVIHLLPPTTAAMLASLAQPEPPGELRFRVYAPPFGLPIGTGSLRPDPQLARWRGDAVIAADPTDFSNLIIDVHVVSVRSGPKIGPPAVAAEASRWAARGLALLRLAQAGNVPDPSRIRELLEHARQLFSAAAIPSAGIPSEADAQLVRRQLARTDAVLAAHLRATGQERPLRRVIQRMSAYSDVDPADIAVPDLALAAWAPTLTERALLDTGL